MILGMSDEDYSEMKKRADKLAMQKSHLQLIISLMQKLGMVTGLENTTESLIKIIIENIGGTNVSLYYKIEEEIFVGDTHYPKIKIDCIQDKLVNEVFITRKFIELENEFTDTLLQTQEFTKAYTWVFPLIAGVNTIGVVKIDNLHITSMDFKNELPTFFNYAAIVLKNEILKFTNLTNIEANLQREQKLNEELTISNNQYAALNEEYKTTIEELNETNKDLKSSHDFTEMLINTIPDPIFAKDKDHKWILVNDALCELMGQSREKIIGKSDYDYFPKDQADVYWDGDERVFSTGEMFQVEELLTDSSGKVHHIQTKKKLAHGRDESDIIVCIIRDITERKIAELLLKEKNEEIEAQYEEYKQLNAELNRAKEYAEENGNKLNEAQSIAHIGNWELNLLDNTLTWSDEIYRIFGCKPQEFGATYEAFLNFIHPDDRDFVNNSYLNHINSKVPYDIVHRILLPNNEIKYVNERCKSDFDAQGKPLRSIGTVADITDKTKAEEALKLTQHSIDNITDSVFWINQSAKLIFVNQAACRNLEYSKEELLDFLVFDVDPLFPQEKWEEHWNEIFLRSSFTFETFHKTKTGRQYPVEVTTNKVEFNGVQYNCAIARDISQRKLTEDTLRFISQRGWLNDYKTFFHSLVQYLGGVLSVDYVFIDRLDAGNEYAETVALCANGTIVPNMRYELKYTPCENVITKSLCCYSKNIQDLFPDDILLKEMNIESYAGIPLWDSTGNVIGLIAVMDSKPIINESLIIQQLQLVATRVAAEIERESADNSLKESEQKYRSLAENIPDCIMRYDENCRTIYLNNILEKALNTTFEEIKNLTPTEFQSDGRFDVYEKYLKLVIATGEVAELEFSDYNLLGKVRHNVIEMIPERNNDGEIVGALAIGRDITERKNAEEEIQKLNLELEKRVVERTAQLEAANKELEAFSYSVAHDLRSPLRSIDGFSQILLEDYTDTVDGKGKDYLHRIRASTLHMDQLIDDMLNLSRVSRGEMNIFEVSLSDIAKEVAENLKRNKPERKVKFIIQDEITVQGDYRLLRIVFENLIGNAWKFTSKHSTAQIEFGMFQQNESIVYYICDDGAGFDMEYSKKLFGIFQRLHTVSEFEGTGIGLATVHRVIHRHGGTIWAKGEIEKGATFYFTIS